MRAGPSGPALSLYVGICSGVGAFVMLVGEACEGQSQALQGQTQALRGRDAPSLMRPVFFTVRKSMTVGSVPMAGRARSGEIDANW